MSLGGGPLAGHGVPGLEQLYLLDIAHIQTRQTMDDSNDSLTPAATRIGLMPPTPPQFSCQVEPTSIYVFYDNCFNNTYHVSGRDILD